MRRFWDRKKPIVVDYDGGEVKILVEKPPVWDSVCTAFKINPVAFFTYGDTIYNPNNLNVPIEIIAHEKVHMEQQNYNDKDAALWWGKYLRDPQFRLEQEAKAYGKQYSVICSGTKDRNARFNYLTILAKSLSGPLYNNMATFNEAINIIKQNSGII